MRIYVYVPLNVCSMYMCIYIYAYAYVYICVCACAYVFICVYAYLYLSLNSLLLASCIAGGPRAISLLDTTVALPSPCWHRAQRRRRAKTRARKGPACPDLVLLQGHHAAPMYRLFQMGKECRKPGQMAGWLIIAMVCQAMLGMGNSPGQNPRNPGLPGLQTDDQAGRCWQQGRRAGGPAGPGLPQAHPEECELEQKLRKNSEDEKKAEEQSGKIRRADQADVAWAERAVPPGRARPASGSCGAQGAEGSGNGSTPGHCQGWRCYSQSWTQDKDGAKCHREPRMADAHQQPHRHGYRRGTTDIPGSMGEAGSLSDRGRAKGAEDQCKSSHGLGNPGTHHRELPTGNGLPPRLWGG